MKKIISFLSYHNAVPAVLIILALGAGATFAATTNDVLPLADSTASSTPSGPDASFLIATDLDTYTPTAKVTGVTEDSDNYYVSYALSTIAIVGNAWQPTIENETLTVSKAALGAYRDLGLYVADQLQQRTAQELAYLQRAQEVAEAAAQNGSSGAQIASAYADLVGKTLDADSSSIPGYTPVVENPVPAIPSAPQEPAQLAATQNETPQSEPPSDDISAASSTQPQSISGVVATSTDETDATSSPAATQGDADADASSTQQAAPAEATSTDDSLDASTTGATAAPQDDAAQTASSTAQTAANSDTATSTEPAQDSQQDAAPSDADASATSTAQ